MGYLTIALAKGRTSDKVIPLLEKAGINCQELKTDSRKLILEDKENKIRFLLVKPADVPTYVECGSGDIGIVGNDVILEEGRNLFEPLDLKLGKCDMVIAGMKDVEYKPNNPYTIASKYTNIAADYFSSKNMDVKIIKLSGSVELGPVIGLSDLIVDIVETGSTLKENGLEIKEKMFEVSARLVVNKASMKVKNKRIMNIIENLEKALEEN